MTIIVRSMYNFVNCLQFNIRYEKVERPAPVGGALVYFWNTVMKPAHAVTSIKQSPVLKGHHCLVLSMKIVYALNLF